MNQNNIQSFQQLPIKYSQRLRTDLICTYISTILLLIMFITACCLFDMKNLTKMTYPTDTDGQTCGNSLPNYPYVYYTSLHNSSKRLCLNQCPNGTETRLKCHASNSLSCLVNTNQQFEVQIYPTELETTRMGLFCLPKNQRIKNQLIKLAGLQDRFKFFSAYDTILLSFLISLIVGILYFTLVQFISHYLPKIIILIGGILFSILSILIWILFKGNQTHSIILKIILSVILLFIGILLLYSSWKSQNQIKLCGIFLNQSTQVIKQNLKCLLVIPAFIIFTAILFMIFLFQLLAYWSASKMILKLPNTYYSPEDSTLSIFLIIINFIELFWGLSFLKEACNFILSGQSIKWYFSFNKPVSEYNSIVNLIKYHWGSVVAGSFILGLFSLLDLIMDTFMPQQQKSQQNQNISCYTKCCNKVFGSWIKPLLELVRSQAMAYINLTGLAYCNASRYCQYINYDTDFFNGNQSINRMYRLGAHCTCISLTIIICLISKNITVSPSFYAYLFILINTTFIVTFFISGHSDASEGILITYLTQEFLKKEQDIQICPSQLKQAININIEQQKNRN